MKLVTLSVVMAALAFAQPSGPGSFIVKAVEPDYGADAGKPFLSLPFEVEVTVLPDGTPYSAEADSGLPHNIVVALQQYRFRPDRKAYGVRFPLESRIPIESYSGRRRLAYNLRISGVEAAQKLDTKKAMELERRLKPTAESVPERTTLLLWAASRTEEAAREIRARQIAWLVQNQPGAEVLRSPEALVSSHAGPLADPAAYATIRQLWLDTVRKSPADAKVLESASNFLRVEDPQEVQRMLARHAGRFSQITTWLGDVYALAMMGVTSLDTETGEPATAAPVLPNNQFTVFARAALADSSDLTLLLPAFDSLSNVASILAAKGRLPEGYKGICEPLAARIRGLQPNAVLSCESPAVSGQAGQNAAVTLTKRTKLVGPTYPNEAKARRIEGRVTLTAIINKAGKVEDLRYVGGPFVLYESSRKAVLQWEYLPTTIDGQPVDIVTDIEVNYSLR